MRTARHFSLILRLVLAWFVLSLGAAAASPLVKPQDILLVCSASGTMKVFVKTLDGSDAEPLSSAMDCPLCASYLAPLPEALDISNVLIAFRNPPVATPLAPWVLHAAAPPPARGPPVFS